MWEHDTEDSTGEMGWTLIPNLTCLESLSIVSRLVDHLNYNSSHMQLWLFICWCGGCEEHTSTCTLVTWSHRCPVHKALNSSVVTHHCTRTRRIWRNARRPPFTVDVGGLRSRDLVAPGYRCKTLRTVANNSETEPAANRKTYNHPTFVQGTERETV